MGRGLIWAALAGMAFAAPVAAQEQAPPSGTVLRLDVSETLRFHDNLGLNTTTLGSTLRSDTALRLSLESETRTQRFAVALGGTFRAENAPVTGGAAEIVSPIATLSYQREGARARLNFDASYAQADVDGLVAVFDPNLGTASLVSDSGTRRTYNIGTRLTLGQDRPLGLTFEARTAATLFDGTVNTSLFDSRTHSGSVAAGLAFSPVTEGTARLSFARYDAEDAPRTQRDTLGASLGLEHALASGTVLSASLGARRIDDSVTGVRNSGEGRLRLVRDRPNGEISAELSTSLTVAGRLDRAYAERQLEFPGWTATARLGVANVAGITTQPTLALAYAREMKRGEIGASLSSDVSVSNQTQVSRVLTGRLNISQSLTEASALRLGLSVTDVRDAGTTGVTETRRGSVDLSYLHELTRDWSVTAGVSWRGLQQSGVRARDNAVFLTIDRSFTLLR